MQSVLKHRWFKTWNWGGFFFPFLCNVVRLRTAKSTSRALNYMIFCLISAPLYYCAIYLAWIDLVSASDVTPTDRWLNVWCIWYTYLETLQQCRSHRRIGWIIQDFRETCVSRSLTFRLETKMPWRQTLSWKKKAVVFTTVTTSAYQDQLNAGFSKVCEIFKVCGIEALKYIQEFHTPVWFCGDISTPRNVTLNETNCDWLFDMSVKRPHGRALANKCCHLFQTFSRQSEGLATRD